MNRRGFSLVELAIALAAAAFCLCALVAVLGSTAENRIQTRFETVSGLIVYHLRARLFAEPDWEPEPVLRFDFNGNEAAGEDAPIRVETITANEKPYDSARLEMFHVKIYHNQTSRLLETFTLSRARRQIE